MNHNERVIKRKFNLLELIIVIATLGVLLTILLPSLRGAKERAYTAVCLSNQKQIGVAIFMYSKSHNAAIPSRLFLAQHHR